MSDEKYNILYSEDPKKDADHLSAYLDEIAKEIGIQGFFDVRYDKVSAVTGTIHFDLNNHFENKSPFKKAANFAVQMSIHKPIVSKLPDRYKINDIPNHQNAFFAYYLAVDSLHTATLYKGDKIVCLENRIKVSSHTFREIIEALSGPFCPGPNSVLLVSLLFEQLVYRTNPSVSYPLTV